MQLTSRVALLDLIRRTANIAQRQKSNNSKLQNKDQPQLNHRMDQLILVKESHRFCSYNVQGLLSPVKQRLLADDFFQYKIKTLMIQETNIKGNGTKDIVSSSGQVA